VYLKYTNKGDEPSSSYVMIGLMITLTIKLKDLPGFVNLEGLKEGLE
jgi:hypothetical protein